MSDEQTDGYRAGRLLHWALQGRALPALEPAYQALLDRYLDQPAFARRVQEVAAGLGLEILDASAHGLIVAPTEDSIFALRPAQFRPTSGSADDRLLDGLVQIGIAATVYPRDSDLAEDRTIARPAITVAEVEETLRRLCERWQEEARRRPDPQAVEDAGLEEAWRLYLRRVAVQETQGERRAPRTTHRLVEYGLDRLREFGCFQREGDGPDAEWRATYRYGVLVERLAATTAWEAVQRSQDGEDARIAAEEEA